MQDTVEPASDAANERWRGYAMNVGRELRLLADRVADLEKWQDEIRDHIDINTLSQSIHALRETIEKKNLD